MSRRGDRKVLFRHATAVSMPGSITLAVMPINNPAITVVHRAVNVRPVFLK